MPRHRATERKGHDPVTWVCVFFMLNFFLQRISILPNLSISVSTPLVLIFVVLAVKTRVGAINGDRALLWLVAAGVGALVVIPQALLVTTVDVSVNSWLFWVVSWLPFALVLRPAGGDTFVRTLRALAYCGIAISLLSGVFVLVQLTPFGYRDFVGEIVPDALQVKGYVITYSTSWNSGVNKSNAWFALEPSFLSYTLGATTLAALVARMRVWVLTLNLVGMLTSFSGSGIAILVVGVTVLLVTGRAGSIRGQLFGGLGVLIVGYFTPLKALVYDRVLEAKDPNSSTALRTFEPYAYLLPHWISDPAGMIFGFGAGASRTIIENTGVLGLLVPNVAKVIFDYGMIAGGLLVLVMVFTCLRSPCPAIGVAFLLSTLVLQASSQPLMNIIFALATWFAPASEIVPARTGDEVEDAKTGSRLSSASM